MLRGKFSVDTDIKEQIQPLSSMSRYRKRIARITHAHTHTTHKPVQHGHHCFTSVNNSHRYPTYLYTCTSYPTNEGFSLNFLHQQDVKSFSFHSDTTYFQSEMKDLKAFCQSLTSADDLRHWFIYIFVVQRSYQTQLSLSTSVPEQSPEHATPSNRQNIQISEFFWSRCE